MPCSLCWGFVVALYVLLAAVIDFDAAALTAAISAGFGVLVWLVQVAAGGEAERSEPERARSAS